MNSIDVKCPSCDSDKSRKRWSFNIWKVVKCKNCGLHYTNPRPDTKELAGIYDESYYDYYWDGQLNKDEAPSKNKSNFVNRIEDLEHYSEKRGKVIELGPAFADFLHVLKKRGWQVTGVEISEDAVKQASALYKINLFNGMLEDFTTEEKFDAVVMYQMLEHVPDPKYVLKRSLDLLVPSGLLIVEVPNIDSFDFKWSYKTRMTMIALPKHLIHFNKKSLIEMIEGAGFEVLEVDLYLPKFMRFILNRTEPKTTTKILKDKSSNEENIPKLSVKSSGWKIQLLKLISIVFPGWRITVIARKKQHII